ncbi:hypothetical protein CBA19C6_24095 [Cupriavidus pauculus]|nr:hypothetical protein CBA19C6_24095 [Cupriavidus pauculus]
MSMRELDRMKVIQAVADGHLARWRAAERLGISTRHVRRLVLRLLEDGPGGLVSRKRGRSSNRQLPPGLESRVRGLIRDSYADFGPTLAAEKLRERHGIEMSPSCVRRIMIDAGFLVPRKLRPPKVHQPRNRRACLGELVQIDGSDHAWFEDRAPACTLLVYVDDATSRLMQLLFVPTESTLAYFMNPKAEHRARDAGLCSELSACPALPLRHFRDSLVGHRDFRLLSHHVFRDFALALRNHIAQTDDDRDIRRPVLAISAGLGKRRHRCGIALRSKVVGQPARPRFQRCLRILFGDIEYQAGLEFFLALLDGRLHGLELLVRQHDDLAVPGFFLAGAECLGGIDDFGAVHEHGCLSR